MRGARAFDVRRGDILVIGNAIAEMSRELEMPPSPGVPRSIDGEAVPRSRACMQAVVCKNKGHNYLWFVKNKVTDAWPPTKPLDTDAAVKGVLYHDVVLQAGF